MKLQTSLAMLFFALITSSCTQTLWIQNDFDSIKQNIDSVSIIFPQIEYSVKYGEVEIPKTGYSVFVSQNVADALKEAIHEGHFVPKSASIVYDTMMITKWLQRRSSNPMTKYRPMRDSLQASPDETKPFPLTPELQSVVEEHHIKYFIVVTGVAFGVSEGKKHFDLLQRESFRLFYDRPFVYDYQWYGLQMEIALVDAASNKVLWYNYNKEGDSNYNPLEKERVKDLCLKLLKAK